MAPEHTTRDVGNWRREKGRRSQDREERGRREMRKRGGWKGREGLRRAEVKKSERKGNKENNGNRSRDEEEEKEEEEEEEEGEHTLQALWVSDLEGASHSSAESYLAHVPERVSQLQRETHHLILERERESNKDSGNYF